MDRPRDEYGDEIFGVRLNYAAKCVSDGIRSRLPKTKHGIAEAAKNLRESGGTVVVGIAAQLIENALALIPEENPK